MSEGQQKGAGWGAGVVSSQQGGVFGEGAGGSSIQQLGASLPLSPPAAAGMVASGLRIDAEACPDMWRRQHLTDQAHAWDAFARYLRGGALDRLAHVPGLTKCDKCGFSLLSNNLHAETGEVSARDEPSVCPNDGTPMRRVTEREAGNDLLDRWDRAGPVSVTQIEALLAEHGQRNVKIQPDGAVMVRALDPQEPTC